MKKPNHIISLTAPKRIRKPSVVKKIRIKSVSATRKARDPKWESKRRFFLKNGYLPTQNSADRLKSISVDTRDDINKLIELMGKTVAVLHHNADTLGRTKEDDPKYNKLASNVHMAKDLSQKMHKEIYKKIHLLSPELKKAWSPKIVEGLVNTSIGKHLSGRNLPPVRVAYKKDGGLSAVGLHHSVHGVLSKHPDTFKTQPKPSRTETAKQAFKQGIDVLKKIGGQGVKEAKNLGEQAKKSGLLKNALNLAKKGIKAVKELPKRIEEHSHERDRQNIRKEFKRKVYGPHAHSY